MELRHIQPKAEILQQHIDFFYFVKEDSPEFVSQFYAFPHYSKPLNLHKAVDYEIGDNSITVKGKAVGEPQILLQGSFHKPLFIRFEGKMDKVTIIFRPLGLAHFIDVDYARIASQHTQVFDQWSRLTSYQSMLDKFFATENELERVALLEACLLSVYRPLPHYTILHQAITMVADVITYKTIADVAQALFLTPKTLNRLFKKHLACSPMQYRMIAQFRHSLENKYVYDQFKTVTDLAYGSNVYDLSYLTRIYKSLAKNTPKAFFTSIAPKCDDKVIFQFVDQQ